MVKYRLVDMDKLEKLCGEERKVRRPTPATFIGLALDGSMGMDEMLQEFYQGDFSMKGRVMEGLEELMRLGIVKSEVVDEEAKV